MLNDVNYIKQFDVSDALGFAGAQYEQVKFSAEIFNAEMITGVNEIENIVISSIGGSALSASFAKTWLKKRRCCTDRNCSHL
jgi:glucose-6-phosphate isomerase